MSDEVSYPTITITVDDPDTGMTTTISGTAKVDITTVASAGVLDISGPYVPASGPPSLRLIADWVRQEDGEHYTITRLPTPDPTTY